MLIDLPPHIEQIIISQAQIQGISVAEFIIQKVVDEKPNSMIEAVMALEPSQSFKEVDAVALQREWRNEWR